MRLAAVFALAPALFAAGRLELFHAPVGQPEQQITGTFSIEPAPVTDTSEARFRIRNVGDAPVTLTKLQIAGSGFSLAGAPSLPHIVAAATNVAFTVRFSPHDYGSYSGLLSINGATYVIKGLGFTAIAVLYEDRILTAGDTVDFGRIERGSITTRWFKFRNTTGEPLGVTRATVSGPNFYFSSGPPTPYLQPGESVGFDIYFNGRTAGVFKEQLTVDRRVFHLTGTVVDPPLPRPTLVLESAALRSGQQGRVAVRLAEKPRSRGTGTLRIEFEPAEGVKDNDDALRFLHGSRKIDFSIGEGNPVVYLAGKEAATFQTGTTAGTIVLTVEAGGYTDRATVVVEPEPVRVDRASAVRGATAIDVRLTGFDNTRSVSTMNFNFHLTNGQTIPARTPVSKEFTRWWTESKLGGIFGFRASFPVNGDTSQISAVDVEISNSQGNTRTERLAF